MNTEPDFPGTAEELLNVLAIISAGPFGPNINLSGNDCAKIVSHVRTQANTLASTQAELELCRKAHGEQAERVNWLEAQANTSFYNAHNFAVIKSQRNEARERLADCEQALAASESAHLATRRALVDLYGSGQIVHFGMCNWTAWKEAVATHSTTIYGATNAVLAACSAARAEVAKADQPKTCGECRKFYSSGMCPNKPYVAAHESACRDFRPRADAQKGGGM